MLCNDGAGAGRGDPSWLCCGTGDEVGGGARRIGGNEKADGAGRAADA